MKNMADCEPVLIEAHEQLHKMLIKGCNSLKNGSLSRIRTYDHSINSRELYR